MSPPYSAYLTRWHRLQTYLDTLNVTNYLMLTVLMGTTSETQKNELPVFICPYVPANLQNKLAHYSQFWAPPSTTPSLPMSSVVMRNAENVEDDAFVDACEQLPPQPMDLHTAFKECELAIRKFFNNELIEAVNLMKTWDSTSLYHSLGTAIFEFIPAMLSFDHAQIMRAQEALKRANVICDKQRKVITFAAHLGTIIKKSNYSMYTDLEAHAELVYAEILLLQAILTVLEGEDLAGLIKGTLKIKNCYGTYKECARILEQKCWNSEISKMHFQSGVRLGTATFNVMISLLPPKIISLLEFVGFSANKESGLQELEAGSRAPGLRSVLCDLTLLGYHLVICHFIGAPTDMRVCKNILTRQLKLYPESVWFLIFEGRLELMQGNFVLSNSTYQRAIKSQNKWEQFQHVCYWEVMWIHSLQMEWQQASRYADRLLHESSWSKTIYSYCKAALLLQNNNLTYIEKKHCEDLLRNALVYKQRIAGKSLPMEKFVIKRCARYNVQDRNLLLPAVELMCLWNMFHILAKNEIQIQKMLKLIEATQEEIEMPNNVFLGDFENDNRALLWFLRGCCLAAMKLPSLAIDSFTNILNEKHKIKEDKFLIPYSLAEMAMCKYQLGEKEKALQMLVDVRKKYSGYSLESRLHFRLHSKIEIIKSGHSADLLDETFQEN